MNSQQRRELAKHLAKQLGAPQSEKGTNRHLSVVGSPVADGLSAMERDVLYSRIRDLGNLYWLNWLIRQETMHVLGVMECLSDEELGVLLAKMERGVEARMDGVAFDEVGLVRGATCNWVA